MELINLWYTEIKCKCRKQIQLNPAITDLKGPTISVLFTDFCYCQYMKLTNILSRDLKTSFIIGGIPLLAGPVKRGATVHLFSSNISSQWDAIPISINTVRHVQFHNSGALIQAGGGTAHKPCSPEGFAQGLWGCSIGWLVLGRPTSYPSRFMYSGFSF